MAAEEIVLYDEYLHLQCRYVIERKGTHKMKMGRVGPVGYTIQRKGEKKIIMSERQRERPANTCVQKQIKRHVVKMSSYRIADQAIKKQQLLRGLFRR